MSNSKPKRFFKTFKAKFKHQYLEKYKGIKPDYVTAIMHFDFNLLLKSNKQIDEHLLPDHESSVLGRIMELHRARKLETSNLAIKRPLVEKDASIVNTQHRELPTFYAPHGSTIYEGAPLFKNLTIKEVWREYSFGLYGNMSIKELDHSYGSSWRKSIPRGARFSYNRRIKKCKLIEYAISKGIPAREACEMAAGKDYEEKFEILKSKVDSTPETSQKRVQPIFKESNQGISENVGEPVYCYCRDISYDEMIACDSQNCKIEWFHLECVGLSEPPTGVWYCKDCTAIRKKTAWDLIPERKICLCEIQNLESDFYIECIDCRKSFHRECCNESSNSKPCEWKCYHCKYNDKKEDKMMLLRES